MKKIVLSTITVLAMSTFAVAGGDVAPVVEETPVVPEAVMDDSGFYLGVAASFVTLKNEAETAGTLNGHDIFIGDTSEFSHSDTMLQVGYKFNPYIAVEGRYWFTGDPKSRPFAGLISTEVDYDAWALYVKPMYPVTDSLDVYALLGYGSLDYDMIFTYGPNTLPVTYDNSFTDFSYGIGLSYAFTESFSVFADYTRFYDDTNNFDFLNTDIDINTVLSSWNIGIAYTF